MNYISMFLFRLSISVFWVFILFELRYHPGEALGWLSQDFSGVRLRSWVGGNGFMGFKDVCTGTVRARTILLCFYFKVFICIDPFCISLHVLLSWGWRANCN